MQTPSNPSPQRSGFSLVEVLSLIAIVGILALIGIVAIGKLRPATVQTKLVSEINQLNSAINVYLTSGGTLDDVTSPAIVVARLQSKMLDSQAQTFVGFTGTTIDERLRVQLVAASEEGSRAIYDPDKKRFVLSTDPVEGIRFVLDLDAQSSAPTQETRNDGVVSYAQNSTWVWDYSEGLKSDPISSSGILTANVDPSAPPVFQMIDPIDPVAPGDLRKLLPPVFSLPSGSYDLDDFPMVLELINPNEIGTIIYGVLNSVNWEWTEYTEPITIDPGNKVVAFVESPRPQLYHNSGLEYEHYQWRDRLDRPWFEISSKKISQVDGVSMITIHENNDPNYYLEHGVTFESENPFEVRYRIIPLGSGVATSWVTYEDPFNVAAVDFADGFKVYAKVVSSAPQIDESWSRRATVYTYDPDNPDDPNHPDYPGDPDPNDPGPGGTEELPPLAPPHFSILTGYYEADQFPLTLTLADPNPPGAGKLVYTMNGSSQEYTGPLSIAPNTQVVAWVEALDVTMYTNSASVWHNYMLGFEPGQPIINLSDSEMDARYGSVSIDIYYEQTSSTNYDIQYKLLPKVAGEGTATDWTAYTGSFGVGGPQFPRGFDLVARLISPDPSDTAVREATAEVDAYYTLDRPTILSNVDSLNDRDTTAIITLQNSNPVGVSEMVYQVLGLNEPVGGNWLVYSSSFVVDGTAYPEGVKIVAKSTPLDPYYRDSDPATRALSAKFFDIEVTWNTIFVLDSSGSMVSSGRMTRLQNQVKDVLAQFAETDNFAIIDYDDDSVVVSGWGPATDSRKQAAYNAIDGISADGATNYHSGLQSALNLGAGDATQVIFLSDGMPFNPDLADPEMTDGILELVDDIIGTSVERLDTIALGINSQILQDMADRGGGNMVIVND